MEDELDAPLEVSGPGDLGAKLGLLGLVTCLRETVQRVREQGRY